MPRATLSLACLWWLTLVGAAAAQSGPNSSDPGFASLQNFSGGVSMNGTYLQVQNVAGNGVGWRNGFTQLGILSPYWVNDDFVIAANGRLLITDNQQIGGNFGGIARYYQEDWDRILGANAYYDIDQTTYQNNFRQGGFGIETLGQWWDFRANGYIPTSTGNNFLGAVGMGQDPFFFGNRVGFLGVGLYEQSLVGGDFEFGLPVTPETPWLRAYSGMYFYRGNGKGVDPVGYRGRVEGWLSDDLSLGMNVSYDEQFGTNLNCVVNFLFSGWKPTRWFPNFTTRERMLTPVQRNWRIATSTYNEKVNIPAFNPRTNEPYFITWVDDSRILPGNGTFERPLNFLPPAAPRADMILVRVGNTSAAAPLTGSIQLSDFQRLLGEGRDHKFDAYAQFGRFVNPVQTYSLPDSGFVDNGVYPYLSSAGNTVTIANNNEVSAFNLVDAVGAGITNVPTGSHNFDLNHLDLINNAGGGILLTETSGIGRIDTVNALDNAAGGISVDSNVNPLFLTLQDVTSNGTPAGGQLFGINIHADGPTVALLNNVTANGNGTGIILSETNTSLQAILNTVNAMDNLGDGLVADGLNGSISLNLNTVDTSNNGGRGIFVTGDGTAIDFYATNLTDNSNGGDNINFTVLNGGSLTGGLFDTHFDDSTGGSGIVLSSDTGSLIGSSISPFLLQNVTGDRNAEHGLSLLAGGASVQFVTVLDGAFSDNGIDGIHQVQPGGSFITLVVDPTTIDRNGRDGYHLEMSDGSTSISSFSQDTLNDNGRSAVYGDIDLIGTGNSLLNLTLLDTPGLRSGADGMRFNSNQQANLTVNVTDGDFSDSGQTTAGSSAVRFDATNSIVNLTLVNTPGTNTNAFPAGPQEFGLQANLNSSILNAAVTDGKFSENLQDGIRVVADNFSTALLNLTNGLVDHNGLDGMFVRSTNGSDFTANVFDSSFSQNGQAGTLTGQGLDLGVNGTAAPASLSVSLANTAVNFNEMHGIFGDATGTLLNSGLLRLIAYDSTTIDNNGRGFPSSGVFLRNISGVVQADFTDADISGNTGRGVAYFGVGQGPIHSTLRFTNTAIGGTVNVNALDGLNFQVTAGNQLHIAATSADFSNNGLAGINGLVDGVGSQAIINQFLDVTADGNTREGLNLVADNGGFLNANINGGSFSGNGLAGAFDGVNVLADNAGLALLCFDGTAVDNNTLDGFNFLARNNGEIRAALQTSGQFGTLSASNNPGFAVDANANTGGSVSLFMDGPNVFNNSGSGFAAIHYAAANAARAAFSFSGTSDGNAGDAIVVEMTNIADAYIDIHGPGSLSNNGSSAVVAALNNVTFGAAPLSVDFLQGTFTANPFNISDLTMSNNGDQAVVINAVNVNMPVGTISRNTISSSGQNGSAEGIRIDTVGGTFGNFSVDNNTSSANPGIGIHWLASGTTFNTLTFDQNTMVNNTGDGLTLDFVSSPITTLNVTNNTIGLSGGHGVNLDLTASPITTLNLTGNSIGVTTGTAIAFLDDSLPVIRAGFNANTLAANDDGSTGLVPVGFNLNFFGQLFNSLFVNNNGNVTFNAALSTFTPFPIVNNGIPMIAPFFADVDTRSSGLPVTYGNGVIAGRQAFGVNWVDVDYFSGAHPAQHNDFQLVMIDRSDVAAGDFDFEFNYGNIRWETGNASGGTNGIGGNSARVGYTNGTTQSLEFAGSAVNGAFLNGGPAATRLIGNSLNSTRLGRYQFAARSGAIGGGIAGNGGDGVHIDQLNSDITTFNALNNIISNNAANGLNFATVNNSALTNVNINGNTIESNTGDGVRLVNPTLPLANKTLNIVANNNTIDLNTGNGINLQLSNGEQATLAMAGNTIGTEGNGNSGMGVRAVISGNSALTSTIGDAAGAANTFTANRDAGFGLLMSDNTTGGLTVVNSSFNNTVNGTDASFAGNGLGVIVTNNVQLNPVHIGTLLAQNTTFNNNAAEGILFQMHDNTRVVGQMQLFNVQANANGTQAIPANGTTIRLRNTSEIGDGVGGLSDLLILGNTAGASMSSNTGHGLRIERGDNSGLPTVDINGMTISSNTLDGISLVHSNGIFNASPTKYNIQSNTITSNRTGIALDETASARVVADIFLNTITDNRDNGFRATLNQTTALGNPVGPGPTRIDGNTFARNGNAAGEASILINALDQSYANVQISGLLARQTIDRGQNGIIINNTSTFANGAPPAGVLNRNGYSIEGTDISNVENNGITLTNTNASGVDFVIGGPTVGDNVTVTNYGGDGIAATILNSRLLIDHVTMTHPIGTTGGDDGIVAALSGLNNVTIQDTTIHRSGGDGIDITDTGINNVTIRRTTANENTGRGLSILVNSTSGGLLGSVYNVGNAADTGASRNSFSSNGRQGIAYVQRETGGATTILQNPGVFTGATGPGSGTQDVQNIVPVAGTIGFLDLTQNLIVRANVINNDINSNGSAGVADNTDGAIFGVGSNSRLVLDYSGNGRDTAGAVGNLGDDFRIFTFLSTQKAATSFNFTPDNAVLPAVSAQDRLVADPTARIDILFGGNPAANNVVPIAVDGSPFNFGEQIVVQNSAALNVIAGVTNFAGGQLNAEPFLGNTGTRGFQTIGNVWKTTNTVGPLFNLNDNVFTQLGVTQNISGAFTGAGYTPRNGTFPLFP